MELEEDSWSHCHHSWGHSVWKSPKKSDIPLKVWQSSWKYDNPIQVWHTRTSLTFDYKFDIPIQVLHAFKSETFLDEFDPLWAVIIALEAFFALTREPPRKPFAFRICYNRYAAALLLCYCRKPHALRGLKKCLIIPFNCVPGCHTTTWPALLTQLLRREVVLLYIRPVHLHLIYESNHKNDSDAFWRIQFSAQ